MKGNILVLAHYLSEDYGYSCHIVTDFDLLVLNHTLFVNLRIADVAGLQKKVSVFIDYLMQNKSSMKHLSDLNPLCFWLSLNSLSSLFYYGIPFTYSGIVNPVTRTSIITVSCAFRKSTETWYSWLLKESVCFLTCLMQNKWLMNHFLDLTLVLSLFKCTFYFISQYTVNCRRCHSKISIILYITLCHWVRGEFGQFHRLTSWTKLLPLSSLFMLLASGLHFVIGIIIKYIKKYYWTNNKIKN